MYSVSTPALECVFSVSTPALECLCAVYTPGVEFVWGRVLVVVVRCAVPCCFLFHIVDAQCLIDVRSTGLCCAGLKGEIFYIMSW